MSGYRADLPGRPRNIARLPLNKHGYPIPWFVATLDDGTRDFRIMDAERLRDAVRLGRCWVCGQAAGGYLAFTIGPMCVVNRVSAEPPAHRSCAQYSAAACPFLTRPQMVRRETGLEELGTRDPAGIMIRRNPGAVAVWVCRDYAARSDGKGGILFQLGEPLEIEWWAQGRAATHEEILASVESGLPALEASCAMDEAPEASVKALAQSVTRARALIEKHYPTKSITCPRCWMASRSPRDILERYCGACHLFHDEMSGGNTTQTVRL